MNNYNFNNDELVFAISNIVRDGILKKKNCLKVLGYEDSIMKSLGWTIKFADSDLELITDIVNSICLSNIDRVNGDVKFINISPDEVIFRLFYDCYDLFLGCRDVFEKHIDKAIRKLYKKNSMIFKVYFEMENNNNKVK